MALRIEPLSRPHDREGFDCGSEPLNAYLRQTAREHSERGISRTFVLVESPAPKESIPVLGYFTLNMCQIKSEWLPEKFGRKLPREICGLKLGRLAIAQNQQGKGLGKALMAEAMKKALEVFDTAGGIGLFVDAKDERAAEYYRQHGFEPLQPNPLQLFLALETIRNAQS